MDGAARQILVLPLDRIDESPSNPRKHFDPKYLQDLAEDLKAQGQLQPIRVRPKGDRYELVFGACRLRASRIADLATIDATVHEYSDREALEAQLRENAKRLDVHPLEEADGYRELRDVHHVSVEEIAARVTKEPGYIRHRLQFCALGPKAREHFLTGKLTPATALLVARIPVEALREQAAEEIVKGQWGDGPMSAHQAGNLVRGRYMLRLANAPFDRGAEDLVAGVGPCSTCPKRTGAQPELFADVDSPDTCTDPECFSAKKDAAWQQRVEAAKAEGHKVLSKKAAAEVFTYGNRVDRGSAYADLGAELEGFGGKSAAELLKKAKAALPPVTLARDEAGGVHELVDKVALKKSLKAAGIAKPKTERVSGDDDWKAKQRERTAASKAVVDRVLGALIPAAEKAKITLAIWQFLVASLIESSYASSDLVVKRRGLAAEGKRHTNPQERLEKLASTMKEGQLLGLAVELLVTTECGYGHVGPRVGEACKAFAVDLKKIETEVASERKAAAKAKAAKATPKKPAASKSSSAPKPTAKVAKAPAAKATPKKPAASKSSSAPKPTAKVAKAPAAKAAPSSTKSSSAPKPSKSSEEAPEPPGPSKLRVVIVEEDLDFSKLQRGLSAWDPEVTRGAVWHSGGALRPLRACYTPAVSSPDVPSLLGRLTKAKARFLDLGVVSAASLPKSLPDEASIRERWNAAHPEHRVWIADSKKVFVMPKAVWKQLDAATRGKLSRPFGNDVPISVQRTAVTIGDGMAVGSPLHDHLTEVARSNPELHLVEVPANERQCRDCGCVEALACEKGCAWVGENLCSVCEKLAAKAAGKAAKASDPAQPLPLAQQPDVRVWIGEGVWNALVPMVQAKLTEPSEGSSIEWEQRTPWLTALLPAEVAFDLREHATNHQVPVFEGPEAPTTPTGLRCEDLHPATAKKASKPFHKQPFPAADELALQGAATAAWLDGEGWHGLGRLPGEGAETWEVRWKAVTTEEKATHVRLYDAAKRCTFDSRDTSTAPSGTEVTP